jgi:hypothetical protein
MTEYKAGEMMKVGDEHVLVTRIVNSSSYFEDWKTKKTYIVDELYLETLNDKQEINFVQLSEARRDIEKTATLKGPDTLPWRKIDGGVQ